MAHLRNYWTKPRKKVAWQPAYKAPAGAPAKLPAGVPAKKTTEPVLTDTTATAVASPATASHASAQATAFTVILAVSFCHCINDIMQSLLSAIYPLLKENYGLDFWQIAS